ncbi:MAG: DUF3108 domain-containing protein [Gammaproteobacteria bacterium]|nr:DUF3108 domain-containing protein [Gammaproteobacteria bacterium]
MNFANRKIARPIVACLACAFSLLPFAAAAEEQAITPHIAEYKVKVNVLSGRLRSEVRLTDEGYSAHSTLEAAGFASIFVRGDVSERSVFAADADGIRPLRYSSEDRISKEDKFMDFVFDWSSKQVTGTINDEEIAMDLDGPVHDRVSIQYELMLDLLNGRQSGEYLLLDDFESKLLEVTNVGTRTVKVPYGKFEAVGIQHRKKKSKSERLTTLWCVAELDYLPVMIEQHRKGKLRMRAVLTQYEPLTLTAGNSQSVLTEYD